MRGMHKFESRLCEVGERLTAQSICSPDAGKTLDRHGFKGLLGTSCCVLVSNESLGVELECLAHELGDSREYVSIWL